MPEINTFAQSSTPYYFEGVEKLLEIWFKSSGSEDKGDLRCISRNLWEALLKQVKCEIISFSSNDTIDAYVLSESSMFVSKRRWILKTCGTTTPLQCVDDLIKLAAEHGFDEITDLFYSRKNFTRPDLQLPPHRSFCQEVEALDLLFPNARSYCLGTINRECWYLYTFSKNETKQTAINSTILNNTNPDQTIEILMQNLDCNVMSLFTRAESTTAQEATLKTGINKIIPEMHIDDFLFEPCGYSMNGINGNGDYMTIHITPEKQFSYVSFESNIALKNYTGLINQVIRIFKPSKFIVTLFANKSSQAYETMQQLESEYAKLSDWRCTDMQCCTFPSYNLMFAQYAQH